MPSLVLLIFLEVIVTTQASNPRSVNVALETVLEFDSKDDIDFIDTMQNFLKKLKTTITRHRATNDQASEHIERDKDSKKQFVFTDFLTETVTVLKSFKDEDLKNFFNILEREIEAWHTRKEFHEISDNLGFRRLVDRNLQSLKNSPAAVIRRKLNKFSDNLNFRNRNGNNGFIANFLNHFYKKESEANLVNFLNNLKLYRSGTRRNNVADMRKIIRNGILTIIEPFLKLNSNTIRNINKVYNKYIANSSNTNNVLLKRVKTNKSKDNIARDNHKIHDDLTENQILDYIEDHIKIIDKHLTTNIVIKAKSTEKPKRFKTTGTTYRYIRTTRPRKVKVKGSLGRVTKPREHNQKRQRKVVKSTGADDDRNKEPVLIKLTSDDSELKSVESYLSSTTERQKRYKKTTRHKVTKKKPNYLKTTKKFRKAFRTTTVSGEGLSIEHFGSLFGREFHRKNNDNDSFVNAVLNSSLPTILNNATIAKVVSDELSKEIRRNNNMSRENEDYFTQNRAGAKNISESREENITDKETVEDKYETVTESIKIKGNIIIEKPETTLNVIETTTSKPVNNFTTYRNYNVSIVTKYFNVKPMKPTIILRRQVAEISNETEVTTNPATTEHITTPVQTTNVVVNTSKIDNTNTTIDGLENEIEDIIDKYNTTQVPEQFENYIKEVQMNDENKKVRDQMQADLAKLLAPPSTTSTVTVLFTDPFNDIDEAEDIL